MPNSGDNVITESIVFFGSGPVAAASLELLASSFNIEAVITKPRPPQHRGAVPVITTAETLGVPIITTTDKSELSAKIAGAGLKSRVAVLIDFGIIVRQDVIDSFPLGIVNSHFSLLPEWRGADPITFAILSSQQQTGVSLMLLVEAMDEGPLLAQAPYEIVPGETAPTLTKNLIELSYRLLCEILPLYLTGTLQPSPQEAVTLAAPEPTYSRKLAKKDGALDFRKPAAILEREIRAYLEWPKSHTTIAGKDVVITAARVAVSHAWSVAIGTAYIYHDDLLVQTSDGALTIEKLKPAGKSEMSASAFMAGYGQSLERLTTSSKNT